MPAETIAESLSLLKVGDIARRTGKTVRAIHLYEELGLLNPAVRSKGGFRMYRGDGVKRIEWIQKLQDMGFSLTEIKVFLRVWEESATAPKAMATVREIFTDKLRETRETIGRLTRLADELSESLAFLEWLGDNHFTFLGCRDYSYTADEGGRLDPVLDSGLGVLADRDARVRYKRRQWLELQRRVHDLARVVRSPVNLLNEIAERTARIDDLGDVEDSPIESVEDALTKAPEAAEPPMPTEYKAPPPPPDPSWN